MRTCSLLIASLLCSTLSAFNVGGSQARRQAAHKALSLLYPYDPLSYILAGTIALRQVREDVNEARMLSGERAAVHTREMFAVRSKWFDEQMQAFLINNNDTAQQVVMFGAGMSTRPYTLPFLGNQDVFEVDDRTLVESKKTLISMYAGHIPLLARSVQRIAHSADDINQEDVLIKLIRAGFLPHAPSIYIMEGALDAQRQGVATRYLKMPVHLAAGNLLLFDICTDRFIRDPEIWTECQGYHFIASKTVKVDGREKWLVAAQS